MRPNKFLFSHNFLIMFALLLGVVSGYVDHSSLNQTATIISDITIRLMKLISVPLLFLSIISSAAHFTNFDQIKKIGGKIIKYTILTTTIAALVAEVLYLIVSPYLLKGKLTKPDAIEALGTSHGFLDTLISMIPDNLTGAFLENNVIAIVIIAIVLAIAIVQLKEREREVVFSFFVGLLNALMRIVQVGIKFLPIAIWAFITILTRQIVADDTESINAIGGLTLTVIGANLVQGLLVIPILLVIKKINPLWLFKNVKEALLVAFFTRSSMATLPITLDHAVKNAKISEDVARLSLPLCTTINMNGCAQFILLSVYFVSAVSGHPMESWEHLGMIILSIVAAIGNAGVPMGCFFLASSILAAHDIPLHIMGSILPLYTFIDMVETSLNVWSDISVTKIVDRET